LYGLLSGLFSCGVRKMNDYRAYIIGDDDHIIDRIDLLCGDDRSAIEHARQRVENHDIELWQRDRRIARLGSRPKGN
jgi:hypothetical protein